MKSSLRGRLTLLFSLALAVALGAIAVPALVAREVAHDRAAEVAERAATRARALAPSVEADDLAARLDALVSDEPGASAGRCAADGTVAELRSGPRVRRTLGPPPADHGGAPPRGDHDGGPPRRAPGEPSGPSGLLPADGALVEALCRDAVAQPGVLVTRGDVLPLDVLHGAALAPRAGGPAAFVLLRSPPVRAPGAPSPSRWALGGVGLASLLIALGALDVARRLRAGAQSLGQSLVALGADLRAPVARPEARELAEVADGLARLAERLDAAQARERALLGQLAHQERLAGLGRVVAGVAHEVRNPLTAMKLVLDGLARHVGDDTRGDPALADRVRTSTGRALAEIARLDRLVTTILGEARAGLGPRTDVDLAALVDERLGLAREAADARGVGLVRLGEARASADRDGLARVVDNLVRNAVDASARGQEVVVALAARGPSVELRVEDPGPGIAAPHLERLFEPFFTTKGDGTGLGLFAARGIVERHAGTLDYTREGERTVFTARLPASSASDTSALSASEGA